MEALVIEGTRVNLSEAFYHLKSNNWKGYQKAYDQAFHKVLSVCQPQGIVSWCENTKTGPNKEVEKKLLEFPISESLFAINQYMRYVKKSVWPEAVPKVLQSNCVNKIFNFMFYWVQLSGQRAPEGLEDLIRDPGPATRVFWNTYVRKLVETKVLSEDEAQAWILR